MTDETILDAPPADAPPADPPPAKNDAPPADTPPADTPPADTPPAADDDWRKSMAGDNEDALRLLGRYNSPQDAAKAFVEQRQLLSKRDENSIKIPGENATDEERQAFAKALGIPESPDKYDRFKPEGDDAIELSEADQAFVDAAIADLHKQGGLTASPEVVKTFEGMYYKAMEERAAQMAAAAVANRIENEKVLKEGWGSDFKVNMTYAESALQAYVPGGDARTLLDMQLADGTKLGDHAVFIKAMAAAGRATTEDPAFLATLNGGESMSAEALDDEIKKIEGMRHSDPTGYQKNFDRYKMLIAKREQRFKSQAA
jgi:hypothetical protein